MLVNAGGCNVNIVSLSPVTPGVYNLITTSGAGTINTAAGFFTLANSGGTSATLAVDPTNQILQLTVGATSPPVPTTAFLHRHERFELEHAGGGRRFEFQQRPQQLL